MRETVKSAESANIRDINKLTTHDKSKFVIIENREKIHRHWKTAEKFETASWSQQFTTHL